MGIETSERDVNKSKRVSRRGIHHLCGIRMKSTLRSVHSMTEGIPHGRRAIKEDRAEVFGVLVHILAAYPPSTIMHLMIWCYQLDHSSDTIGEQKYRLRPNQTYGTRQAWASLNI